MDINNNNNNNIIIINKMTNKMSMNFIRFNRK